MKRDVLMNGELAGTLSYAAQTHRYAFRYSPGWLSRKARYALGPTLPLELDEAMTEERQRLGASVLRKSAARGAGPR